MILQTAKVTARGVRGTTGASVFFDTGADRSNIRSDLVRKIAPENINSEEVSVASFGKGTPSGSKVHNLYKVHLRGNLHTGHSLLVTETDVICADLCRPEVPPEILASFSDLTLAADHDEIGPQQIDILIGMDAYWRFVGTESVPSVPKGLMAQYTVFGWILSGAIPSPVSDETVVSHQMLCFDNMSDQRLRSFWDLESIGIDGKDSVVDPVLENFQQNLQYVEGKYEVGLPWKSSMRDKLLNNERLARVRLAHLNKNLPETTLYRVVIMKPLRLCGNLVLLRRFLSVRLLTGLLQCFTCHTDQW